jgi:hypothetical protein
MLDVGRSTFEETLRGQSRASGSPRGYLERRASSVERRASNVERLHRQLSHPRGRRRHRDARGSALPFRRVGMNAWGWRYDHACFAEDPHVANVARGDRSVRPHVVVVVKPSRVANDCRVRQVASGRARPAGVPLAASPLASARRRGRCAGNADDHQPTGPSGRDADRSVGPELPPMRDLPGVAHWPIRDVRDIEERAPTIAREGNHAPSALDVVDRGAHDAMRHTHDVFRQRVGGRRCVRVKTQAFLGGEETGLSLSCFVSLQGAW